MFPVYTTVTNINTVGTGDGILQESCFPLIYALRSKTGSYVDQVGFLLLQSRCSP